MRNEGRGRARAPLLLPGLLMLALALAPGCGDSQPATGTAAGEAKEAGGSTQAQIDFMKKQGAASPGAGSPAAPPTP
jgi:hypothetical protein